MNKLRKIAACVLAALSLALTVGCSCSDKRGAHVSGSSLPNVEGTTHERYVGSTSYKLLENGRTEYKILVSEAQKSQFIEAINELQSIFLQATGVQLEVVTEGSYSANAKYISLGDTAALEGSGFKADYQTLGEQGYQIKTVGQSLFVCGKTRGVLYGVYDLLKILVDFETYTTKISYMQTGVNTIALPDLDITEVPDIEYRIPVTGAQLGSKVTAHRQRMQLKDEVIVGEGNAHNILKYIVPITEHEYTHSDWFSGDKTQLCYTAHGNEEEYELMVAEAVDNIKTILERTPNQNLMSITQMDEQTWCECGVCQGLEDHYGTNAASQIFFVNDVTSKVKEWLDTECGGREVQFMFFAYHKSEAAPATQNADGTWTAIDGIKVNDNVSVWIAPLYEDYTISVTHPDSSNIRMMLESWHAVANSYFVWAYNVYFDNYLIPYDSYSSLQDLVKYFVTHNTKFLWVQGNWNLRQNTGYDNLKGYLFAKLMWNCNLDVNDLISDYFDKVYREASDVMEGTFWAWRAFSETQREMGRSGSIYSSPNTADFWTKRYLTMQLDQMDVAKTLIAKYETSDSALYQAIYDSIVCETISPRFLLIKHFEETFEKSELAAFKAAFKVDVNRLDFNMVGEQETIESITES
ncbi:MAG: DUF4838 domain-containing protein [Clostridia bacterium]|nr:DUF4838 domain-containing protein [Clostridia bacterium]